ncbi:LysR family transcriptional regulator [Rhodococcus opacus]|uniref:HTH lysR-type domain-containing protein n=1 Tax=Rhodococcus opacus TaxID=37919 RepID=A0A2S8IZC4_RHOOP|nr:LysR family transcriptional regulator [Rhodococcus opacus]PQP20029.1 hypothetical protein C5613_29240 [Rhodococcus opacus]
MQLVHFEVFLAVVRERSFAGAAKSLWVSPSRVTERMQQLERELGVTLVDRSTRDLTPTQAGRALIPRAEIIVQEFELVRALFPDEEEAPVRVGMRSLPEDFRERLQHEMEVAIGKERLTVLPLDPRTQLELLLSGRLDCGFTWDVPPAPLLSIPVLIETMAVVVPATARFAALDVIRPQDLAGLRMASTIDPQTMPVPGLRSYLDHLPHVDIVNAAVANATYLLVSGGKHCSFVGEASTDHHSLSSTTRRNVLIKSLAEPKPRLTSYLVWRPSAEEAPELSPLLAHLRRRFVRPEER